MFKLIKVGELGEQTVKHLFLLRGQINFAPYYQRQSNIWTLRQKQLLIDTIINSYDIPKFYFHYFTESNSEFNVESNQLYGVVDGKQRMEAIFDFLNDEFRLDENFNYVSDEMRPLKNLCFSDLLERHFDVANKIYDYVLDVVFVQTDELDRLEELFIRLNGGVALTNAEKRNAIGGYLNIEIRRLVLQHKFFVFNVGFKNLRYQHNDLLTKLLLIEDSQKFVPLSNVALEEFLRTNRSKSKELEPTIQRTVNILNVMSDIFGFKDKLLRGKGVIPVYYTFVKNHLADLDRVREFLEQFETVRLHTRKEKLANESLQKYDLSNQQGVNKEKSLVFRYKVLELYFKHFLKTGHLGGYNPAIKYTSDDEQNSLFDEF